MSPNLPQTSLRACSKPPESSRSKGADQMRFHQQICDLSKSTHPKIPFGQRTASPAPRLTSLLFGMALGSLLALAPLACTSPESPSPPEERWMEVQRLHFDPARLVPDQSKAPGEARPQEVRVHEGRVYTVLTHLLKNPGYGTAGPAYLAVHELDTLSEIALIPLVMGEGEERRECRNAGNLLVTDDAVLVSCAGDFDDTGGLAEVLIDGPQLRRIVPTGGAPGALMRTASSVWLADLMSGSLLRVALPSFEVLNGAGGKPPLALCPARDQGWELISALYLHHPGSSSPPPASGPQARAFAACFNAGTVVEFDPLTGKQVGEPVEVGDGPQNFAHSGSYLYVVDNLGATLSRVKTSRPIESSKAVLTLGQVPEGIAAADDLLAVTNSGDGTVTFIEASNLRKMDSVNLKEAEGGTNYPWGVDFAGPNDLLVTLNASNELVHLAYGLDFEDSEDSEGSGSSEESGGSGDSEDSGNSEEGESE